MFEHRYQIFNHTFKITKFTKKLTPAIRDFVNIINAEILPWKPHTRRIIALSAHAFSLFIRPEEGFLDKG